MNWKRTACWSWFALPFLLLAAWAGLASADGSKGLVADAVLYEVWENVIPPAGAELVRVAAIFGSVRKDSPVCAVAATMLPPEATTCKVTAVGTNVVNLITGAIAASGEFKVVIESPSPLLPTNPFDSPELVVTTGSFSGTVTVLPLPAGTPKGIKKKITVFPVLLGIEGTFTVNLPGGDVDVPFTGVFRLPFGFDEWGEMAKPRHGHPAFYLSDSGRLIRVRDRERSLGFPTPRLEVDFPD